MDIIAKPRHVAETPKFSQTLIEKEVANGWLSVVCLRQNRRI